MTAFRSVFQYSLGNALTILAGFVSFPLFTRLLSPGEYGLLSLLNLMISLCLVFSKGGLQQAVIKFWGKEEDSSNIVVINTAFFGALLGSVLILCLAGLGAGAFAWYRRQPRIFSMFALVAGIVVLETCKSILLNRYRAMQKAHSYSVWLVTARYLQLIAAAALLLLVKPSIEFVFLGFMAASLATVLFMLPERGLARIQPASFNRDMLRRMVSFSLPLVFYELINQILVYGDRFLIGYFKGTEAVGLYSAAYNLTFNVQTLMVTSISLALYPLLVEKQNQAGNESARMFLERTLAWFVLFGGVITVGFAAVGSDLLILLAGENYRNATEVVPLVIYGGFMYGVFNITAGDLFITGRTRAMTGVLAATALLNMLLNILLIPGQGIRGAAMATFIAQALLGICGMACLGGSGWMRRCATLAYYAMPPLVMQGVLQLMPASATWLSVAGRTLIGGIIWLMLSLLLFSEVRSRFLNVFEGKS